WDQSVRTDIAATSPQFVNALYGATPNPFNPKTTVRFSVANQGKVTLSVFDVGGRKVRSLVNEVRGVGPHEIIWDGRSDAGQQVASGLYFLRMETGRFSASQKLTLLK